MNKTKHKTEGCTYAYAPVVRCPSMCTYPESTYLLR